MRINIVNVNGKEQIQETFHLSSLCSSVLAAKQISNEEIAGLLKKPSLCDPFRAKGLQQVVDRIYLAKIRNEKVMVCGDYDADGICATTILVDALRLYGITCGFYIPNRFQEGYGLSDHTVSLAHEKGYSLLITVDNGVKSWKALQEAKKRKIDIIVTDHHAMEEEIPCFCLLHPAYMGDEFTTLCGAGVALQISKALIGEKKEHVVLACVASIADVMELKKETRHIVQLGIQYLRQGICVPIQMLANDRYPRWDETLIAYQVVPKLNVTGRLADMVNVNNTVRYLLLDRLEDIQRVAKQITEINEKRKKMSNEMLEKAKTLIHPEFRFQLLFDDHFHEGISGLVAGKLSEELHLPVMVATRNQMEYKGSIRSAGLLDLTTFFHDCMDDLSSYGGHKAAAGIGFALNKKQCVQDYVNSRMQYIQLDEEKCYDVISITPSQISIPEVESLKLLSPFGEGFEEPIFYLSHLPVQDVKVLSNGQHIKWIIDEHIEVMLFDCAKNIDAYQQKKEISIIGNMRINMFLGRKKVNIFVLEVL